MVVKGAVAVALGAFLIASGCITGEDGTTGGAKSRKAGGKNATPGLVENLTYLVYDAVGQPVTPPDELKQPIRMVEHMVGKPGAEPTMGITKNGNVFVVARLSTMKSTDQGVTWTEVYNHGKEAPNAGGLNGSSDVMLWVDPVTDRIFTDHMFGLYCSNMAFSDDDGKTWTQRPLACGIPGNDHQKWASGPWSKKLAPQPPSPAYPSVVYYCVNKVVGAGAIGQTWCAVSYNGGLAFQHEQPVAGRQLGHPCGGINGHPAPAPDGTMYVPLNRGCGGPVVGVTEDNGLTWTVRAGPTTYGGEEIDPEITVTPDGTAYFLWRGSDHLMYLARSKDKFATWEGPWKVSPPDVTSAVFAGMTSGDNGRIAMSYLGTRDTKEYAQVAPPTSKWHLFVTYSLNAGDKEPTFATTQVSTDADPVQIGCIWLSGGGGGERRCRNLLDFIDMTSDKEGRAYVVFADGCTTTHPLGACANNYTALENNSRSRDVAVAVVESGPSLVASRGRIQVQAKADD